MAGGLERATVWDLGVYGEEGWLVHSKSHTILTLPAPQACPAGLWTVYLVPVYSVNASGWIEMSWYPHYHQLEEVRRKHSELLLALEFITAVMVSSMAAGAYGTGSCIMADQKAEKTDQIPKRAYLSKTHS